MSSNCNSSDKANGEIRILCERDEHWLNACITDSIQPLKTGNIVDW